MRYIHDPASIMETVIGTGLAEVQNRIRSALLHAGLEPLEEKYILCSYVLWKLLQTVPGEQIRSLSLSSVISRRFEPEDRIRWPMEDLFTEQLWAGLQDVGVSIDENTAGSLVLCRYPWSKTALLDDICRLVLELLELRGSDQVADLCCGTGGFMATAYRQCPRATITGFERSADKADAARIRAKVTKGRLSVKHTDVLAVDPDIGKRYDKVFCHPPLHMMQTLSVPHTEPMARLIREFFGEGTDSEVSRLRDWLYSLQAVRMTEPHGKTVCLMRDNVLQNILYRKVRKVLVDRGLVECVMTLPRYMLNDASVGAALVVFSRENRTVRMVDAGRIPVTPGWHEELVSAHRRDEHRAINRYACVIQDMKVEDIACSSYSLHPAQYLKKQKI